MGKPIKNLDFTSLLAREGEGGSSFHGFSDFSQKALLCMVPQSPIFETLQNLKIQWSSYALSSVTYKIK